jgi:starch-binding outer membrane protein SusE/F
MQSLIIKNLCMKSISSKFFFLASVMGLAFGACTKMTNTYFANGTAPTLKASATSIAPAPADSLNIVMALSWTNPKYATDSATVKYTIQIDSSGRNFSKAMTIVVSGALVDSISAKQLNTIALGLGFFYNVTYNMDVRIISSYANNNEQYSSNTLTFSYTPYVIPPKVQPPGTKRLYLVGSATKSAWSNPVDTPFQEFEMIDSVDYGGVFNLSGGNQYLLLPLNGDWTNKYAVSGPNIPATGGSFGYNGGDNTYNTNFNGPATSGWYTIIVNFQQGTFTVTPYTQLVPDSLFLVGNATAGGWNNPVPEPSQRFTQINSTQFTINVPLSAGGQYLLLPVNGSWANKFAVSSGTAPISGGTFGYNGNNSTYGSNFNGPANAGNYTVLADFLNYEYSLTPQ